MKYGFIPVNKKEDIITINNKIDNKYITINNIKLFIENNSFSSKINNNFKKLCDYLFIESPKMKIRPFLENIKFIKNNKNSNNNCSYFFSFIQYIYNLFFSGYNFFQESYIMEL